MTEILWGVGLFTAIILALVGIIVGARSKLVSSGNVNLTVNDEKELQVPVGGKLLGALSEAQMFLASACGGQGTCGQCRVQVFSGGGAIQFFP